jgi:iron complex transport system substrate-binding protein
VRIVSLQPFATDILARFGVGVDLVGVTHLCEVPKSSSRAQVLTARVAKAPSLVDTDDERLAVGLGQPSLDVGALKSIIPDVVLAEVRDANPTEFVAWAEAYLRKATERRVKVIDISISTLEQMYAVVEEIGGLTGDAPEARKFANKNKAQLMAWADSFFERCKGKKVVVLSSVEPVITAERWIPDLVKLLGARTIERPPEAQGRSLTWPEIIAGRPDVLVVAPEGKPLLESVKSLKSVQELPDWEELPAVKRGEVIFCSGIELYRPGPKFLRGAAILVSAVAGLDSGYITERDEYFKIRYLELHRHKFL